LIKAVPLKAAHALFKILPIYVLKFLLFLTKTDNVEQNLFSRIKTKIISNYTIKQFNKNSPQLADMLSNEVIVILHERTDEEVAVIIARLHA